VDTLTSPRGRTITFTNAGVELQLENEVANATVTIVVTASLDDLDSGQTTPAQAISRGQVRISGDADFLADAQRLLSSLSARAV